MNKQKTLKSILILFIVIMAVGLFVGCGKKPDQEITVIETDVTSYTEVKQTPEPAKPTETQKPVSTPEPTATPAPTAAPTAKPQKAEPSAPKPQPSTAPTEELPEDESEEKDKSNEEDNSPEDVGPEAPTSAWHVLFETDMEKDTVGEQPKVGSEVNQWGKIVENESKKLYVRVAEEENNKFLRIYAEDGGGSGGPRASRNISIKGMEKLSFEFKVKTKGARAEIQYVDTATTKSLWTGQSENAWTDVKLDMDLVNKTYVTYLNGTQSGEAKTLTYDDATSRLEFRFTAGVITPGTDLYLDDVKISGYGILEADESILGDNNTVNWQNVLPKKALSEESLVNNLVSHPRLFVNSWEEIHKKITTSNDPEITTWYQVLKTKADNCLETEPPGYMNANGRNQLTEAREGQARIMSLSFVYNIEKLNGNPDANKYLEKAYSDMVAMGEWTDWSAFSAYLATAEIMFGYGCAYDWLYDDLSAEQKAEIYEIVRDQALVGLVYNYEGQSTSTNFTTAKHNWNPVCNASAMAAAFAFADEQPLVSEYILERAPEFLINCLIEYVPQGGYPEGTMYWGYGTDFLTFAMHFLDTGFTKEYDIYGRHPKWEYAKAAGIADTGDYHIYYTGPAGLFNYGDATMDFRRYASMYYLAEKFDKPQYALFESKLQKDKNIYLNGYGAIAAICFYEPESVVGEELKLPLDKFYSSAKEVNGMVMRSDWNDSNTLYAAMQGGNNSENHQHFSLGTYIIDFHGKRFVEDVASVNYSLKGSKNTFYHKRAEGYNTLIINPTIEAEQFSDGIASMIKTGSSDSTAFGVMDMSKAYNAGYAKAIRAERGMMLTDNRSRIIVQDEVELDKTSDIYWFSNTPAKIRIAPDGK